MKGANKTIYHLMWLVFAIKNANFPEIIQSLKNIFTKNNLRLKIFVSFIRNAEVSKQWIQEWPLEP